MNSLADEFQKKQVSFSSVEVGDLPFHCPPKDAKKWNMHPKVFLKFDSTGEATCPYCGESYKLA